MSTFSDKLQQATNEDKQVNELYKHELKRQFEKLRDDDWDCSLLTIDIDNPIYFKTDGIFECSYHNSEWNQYIPFYLLMECKLEKDFNVPEQKAEVMLQAVAYLAQIYYSKFTSGNEANLAKSKFNLNEELLNRIERMPSTVFIGSKTTCFAVSSESLFRYYTASLDFDSIKSASTYKNTPQGDMVYNNILRDTMLDAMSPVFNTSDKYCIQDIAEIIYRYNKGIKDADDLSPRNLFRAFTRFTTRVLTSDSVEKLSNRQQASLLAQFIVNRNGIKVVTDLDGSIQGLDVNGLSIQVDTREWNTFSWIYNLKEYGDDEQKKITAITDQLIQEDDRRRKGDFYTPSVWVTEAQKLLDKNLGDNWRNEYMVWDCAWGTGNLTRDCTKLNGTYIKDLYCSTLHETDLEIAERYNANATKFQYDFLNDDVEEMEEIKVILRSPFRFKTGINLSNMEKYINFKDILDLYVTAIDKGIITQEEGQQAYQNAIAHLKNTKLYNCAPTLIDGLLGDDTHKPKKLLFFINPPYAGSGSMTNKSGVSAKESISDSVIVDMMKDNKFGGTNQLYIQFIYRIIMINRLFGTSFALGIFSPSSIMNGIKFEDARSGLTQCGMGYADGFMIQASNFADVSDNWAISFTIWNGEPRKQILNIMENSGGTITSLGYHELKMIDAKSKALEWIKVKRGETKPVIKMTSAINLAYEDAVIDKDALAVAMMDMNIVESNAVRCAIMQAPTRARWSIIDIKSENFDRVISYFTARKLIIGQYANWINSKDEYMIPNIQDDRYEQWQNDSIVYSLFANALNTSSMRNINYNESIWNIQNAFFWMSVKDIADMALGKTSPEDSNIAVCDDIEKFGDNRFVYQKLQTVTLSPDAKAVLDKANALVKSSFKYRKQFDQIHPEYHINTWDAGWYQIKGMLKEYDPDGLKEFNDLYKKLEDRMRPLVYELGFLYK